MRNLNVAHESIMNLVNSWGMHIKVFNYFIKLCAWNAFGVRVDLMIARPHGRAQFRSNNICLFSSSLCVCVYWSGHYTSRADSSERNTFGHAINLSCECVLFLSFNSFLFLFLFLSTSFLHLIRPGHSYRAKWTVCFSASAECSWTLWTIGSESAVEGWQQ